MRAARATLCGRCSGFCFRKPVPISVFLLNRAATARRRAGRRGCEQAPSRRRLRPFGSSDAAASGCLAGWLGLADPVVARLASDRRRLPYAHTGECVAAASGYRLDVTGLTDSALRRVGADSTAQELERRVTSSAQLAREALAVERLALELLADVVEQRAVDAD